MDALVKNSADPAQVRAAGQKEKFRERSSEDDWHNVLNTAAGRRVVWEVLEQCGLLNCAYRPDSETQFYAGRKSIGAWVVTKVTASNKEALYQMSKESEERNG